MDATVIESDKREAYSTYLGSRGYQPVIAYWAEQDTVFCEEKWFISVTGIFLLGIIDYDLKASIAQ